MLGSDPAGATASIRQDWREGVGVDVGRAFGFVFRDPRWVAKVAIGGLLVLVPIIGWLAIYGFGVRITRTVINGQDEPMPEWSEFGGLIGDGFKAFVATFVWSLPATVLQWIGSASDGGGGFAFACLGALVSLAVGFVTPAVVAHVAAGGSIGAGLDVKAVLATGQRGLGNYAIVLLMSIVLGLVAALGLIGFCIGVLFTIAYSLMVSGHLWGQAYRLSQPGAAYTGAYPAPRF